MMLIVAIAIWFALVLLFVALCRIAASADGRDSGEVASTERHSAGSAQGSRTLATGLVVLEEQPAPIPQDLRAKVPGARGRRAVRA
jgi:hypothetical protein